MSWMETDFLAKFREKFRPEKIHKLTKKDFEDFLKACPKLFATRSGSRPDARHEDMHGGLVLATFPETKKALEPFLLSTYLGPKKISFLLGLSIKDFRL